MNVFEYMKETSEKIDEYTLKFISEKIKDKQIKQVTLHLPRIMANKPKITATFGRIIYELLCDKDFEEVIPILASIELAHTSTYVLDDIIDNQPKRWDKKATWKEFGLNYGIVAGNLQAFLSKNMIHYSKLDYMSIVKISKLIDEMWTILWIGEGKNEEMKDKTTMKEYIQRCYEIAGIMLSCAAKMVVISCNKNNKEIEEIGKIGEFYGIGAMIRNDLMDLIPQEIIKKSKTKALLRYGYEDVKKGLWTFPIISAMKLANTKEKKYIESILGKQKANSKELIRITKIVIDCGAVEETLNLITKYKEKAKDIANKLFLDSEKKTLLLDFLEQLENSRSYFKRFKKSSYYSNLT